ncbi:methyltransferase domain-containing protein [Aerococcaceae bacterium DSM 111020]|nr:methyltransferase domain-containing protein [Aerococcaceae bacterium DSM 111020]
MSFHKIASVYDRFNDLSVYAHWLDFTLNALNEEPEKVLDLACGTGWFTQLLSPFCGHITGIDIDQGMLDIAEKELKNLENVTLKQGDMRSLQLSDNQYDLVTCYLDSICFLKDASAVQQAFQEMYRVLKPGGTLLFDVFTPAMIVNNFDNFMYHDYDETAAFMWDSTIYQEDISVSHHLVVFEEKKATGNYQRHEVTLEERTYPLTDYLLWLEQAGFNKGIEIFVDYARRPLDIEQDQDEERWFFRIEK